ncbi:MAG: hypothetical protein ACE5J5_00600 [Candidatus Hydrothermarchaeales archaeon]
MGAAEVWESRRRRIMGIEAIKEELAMIRLIFGSIIVIVLTAEYGIYQSRNNPSTVYWLYLFILLWIVVLYFINRKYQEKLDELKKLEA